jgi:hypothetical protein
MLDFWQLLHCSRTRDPAGAKKSPVRMHRAFNWVGPYF